MYRNNVNAQIKPTTRTRIDLGLAKGDRITHRIPIISVSDLDDGLERWLRIAYELDA